MLVLKMFSINSLGVDNMESCIDCEHKKRKVSEGPCKECLQTGVTTNWVLESRGKRWLKKVQFLLRKFFR